MARRFRPQYTNPGIRKPATMTESLMPTHSAAPEERFGCRSGAGSGTGCIGCGTFGTAATCWRAIGCTEVGTGSAAGAILGVLRPEVSACNPDTNASALSAEDTSSPSRYWSAFSSTCAYCTIG